VPAIFCALVDKFQDTKCLNFSQKLAMNFVPKVNKLEGEIIGNNRNYWKKIGLQKSEYAKQDSRLKKTKHK